MPGIALAPAALPGLDRFDGHAANLRLTRTELLRESGVEAGLLDALEGFGVLSPAPGGPWYDGEALEVLRAAASLAAHGIEARHLRMFRTAADREVALAEQVAAPLQRQGSARRGRAPTAPTRWPARSPPPACGCTRPWSPGRWGARGAEPPAASARGGLHRLRVRPRAAGSGVR